MDFVRPRRPISAALLAGRGHYDAVIQAVMGAKRSVWIATANLKELMVEDPRARPGRRRTMRAGSGRYCSVLEIFAGLGAKGEGRRNFEVGFLSADDLLLDEIQAMFDHVWQGSACAGCKLRALCPLPLDGFQKT